MAEKGTLLVVVVLLVLLLLFAVFGLVVVPAAAESEGAMGEPGAAAGPREGLA